MAKLAIKGHATRGKEVIEILEMLGGKNDNRCCGGFINRIYLINENGYIESCDRMHHLDYLQLTLEEFFEKFPYKIGNKILYNTYGIYTKIKTMLWNVEKERVFYRLESNKLFVATADELQPRKEETIENKLDLLQQLKDYFDNTPREVVEKEWHEYDKYNEISPTVNEYLEYVNKIRYPQYPKTYEECCEVLFPNSIELGKVLTSGYNCELLKKIGELLICRDAYWKIAGDWRPEFRFGKKKYCIMTKDNKVISATVEETNRTLVFPTAEIRDAFYENFKDLIEHCKEFL